MNLRPSSPPQPDALESFANLPPGARARAWLGAAEAATSSDRRSESFAEAAYAFAEAGETQYAVECLDALLAVEEPKVRAAQRGVDAATLVGEHGRALRLYTWVLPTISLDDKRASTAVTLADEAAKLADLALERFFLREAMSVRRSEDLLTRFARSAVQSARAGEVIDDEDRTHAVLSLVHLARRKRGEAGFAHAVAALELDPGNDDALELFVDTGVEAGLHDDVRSRLEAALFVLGADRQTRALARLAAGLDNRPTSALPEPPLSLSSSRMSSIVDLDEIDDEPAYAKDPRIGALLAEAKTLQTFPSLHVTKLREILVIDPLEPEALAALRSVLVARGDNEGLREALAEAADAAKARQWPVAKRLPIVRELAELCAGPLDDPFGAIVALEELVRSDPRNGDARTALRGHLERVGRWDAVVKLLEEGLATAADPGDALAELARIHLERRRDTPAAASALLRRAQLLQTDATAWRDLLELVRTLRDTSRLEATLVEALETIGTSLETSERCELAEELAGLRKASGDLVGAEKLFTEAALGMRDARLFAAAERCASDLGAYERAARASLAQADLADETARAGHLVRASSQFAQSGVRKLALATLRDAVAAGASPDAVAPVLDRCAAGDPAETFEWIAALALRTQRERLGWLQLAERLAGGQSQSPRAMALVKELLRLAPTTTRLRLLAPLDWATDDELRGVVDAVASRDDVPIELRTEAALLTARAHDARGDGEAALRVLRALPRPCDLRVVAELLDLGGATLETDEQMELVGQALVQTPKGSATRKHWVDRAARLAAARGDARAELDHTLELLESDEDDFDRLERATVLARELGDADVLDRCLARAIDIEADEEALVALVGERAELLATSLGRVATAATLVAEHAVSTAPLRSLWVTLAERHGLDASAAETILSFEELAPAEALVDGWLERLPPSPNWLAIAQAAATKSAAPSRHALEIALAREDFGHAYALFPLVGPAHTPHAALEEARVLARLGLPREAFASVIAHVDRPVNERPDALVSLALELAPTPAEAVAALLKADGFSTEAFHDALADVLARVPGDVADVEAVLGAARGHFDSELLAPRSSDVRVVQALVQEEAALTLEAHRALVLAADRLAHDVDLRIEARARAWAAFPELVDDPTLAVLTGPDRVTTLEWAHSRNQRSDVIALALTTAYLETERVEDAHRIAASLVERNPAHRELFEQILEERGLLHDLVASLEKRWSLEKDPLRRVVIARRIADTLETADADPREIADAWRRVLRLDPRDANASAALERAKARALGAPRPEAPIAAPLETIAVDRDPPRAMADADDAHDDAAPVLEPVDEVAAAPASAELAAPPPRASHGFLSMTALEEEIDETHDGPHLPQAPRASNTESAELELRPVEELLAMTSANGEELDSQHEEEAHAAPDLPEPLGSSDMLEDAALMSLPDPDEVG